MLNQFYNLSCYEEFEIQSTLSGISKVDILKEIGHKINDYYFFISNDGIFNWFDLEGNHIEDPSVLKTIIGDYIPITMTKCIIPNSVISIDYRALSFCKLLTSITIPNSVISIGDDTFLDCELLTSITIPDSVIHIGSYAFSYCNSLTSIIIPDSVTSIGYGTFYNCKTLKEITIPDSVINIECEAFSGCESLKEIVIPSSVTSIGVRTFSHCYSLKEIIFKGKTLEQVKQMKNYPFGIEDENIIHISH